MGCWCEAVLRNAGRVDDVAGVNKVGRKTAAGLLRINGHLDRVISNAHKVPGQVGANLRKGVEMARLSRQLVSFKDRHAAWSDLANVVAG